MGKKTEVFFFNMGGSPKIHKVVAVNFRPPAGAPTFTLKKLQKLTKIVEFLQYFFSILIPFNYA